jgi:hypothetical protein
MRIRAAVMLSIALLALGCAGRGRGTGRDRNVITADEIATIDVATAYDVVSRLRPEFLKTRGPISISPDKAAEQPSITVYLDGMESGPVERTLDLIPANQVSEIRLYRAADAVTKYGTRHTGGVIAVTTKRTERP